MSLFICSECGCVENTNLTMNYGVPRDGSYPNLSQMQMHGFRGEYYKTGEREDVRLLCSECNTGSWHGEFPKEQATEAEIIMGEQLQGDEKNVFTFHPFWRQYSDDPNNFDVDMLNIISLAQEKEIVKRTGEKKWCLVDEVGEWKIYKTESGELFAISTDGEDISFEVYPNETNQDCYEIY